MTDTRSHKGRESWALGIANILAGFYGGIAGCAMIGQSVVNVKLGRARTRISTLVAGLVLLLFITVLSDVMARIPMVALAAVMMIVAITDGQLAQRAPINDAPDAAVRDPGHGRHRRRRRRHQQPGDRRAGSASCWPWCSSPAGVAHVLQRGPHAKQAGVARYRVSGPLFFGSSNDLVEQFSYAEDPPAVVIDLTDAQIWDASTVAALDSVQTKYAARGIDVTFAGLDRRSHDFRGRLSGYLNT